MMWNFEEYYDSNAVITDTGENLTYRELDKKSKEFAEAVGGRCLVFVLCKNDPGSLLGYCACLNGNIVPVMLKAELDQEMLAALYKEYEPQYLWVSEDIAKDSMFSNMEKVYKAWRYILYKTPYHESPTMYEELALLLTTSGSTGSPKFVRQSYSNIRANTESIVEYLELDHNERPITTLPMNYTYGLSVINTHLWVGASLLLTDHSLMEKEFWKFIKEGEATSISGVPYTYEMLKKLRIFRMDLPKLRTMTQAGGKLSPELHREFAEFAGRTAKKFIVMYGQCEATARMAYLPSEKALDKTGSMGIAIPGGRFELVDTEGKIIHDPETTGELIYYGDNVTLGYAECREDLKKADERGGRLETGDMAYFDSDGYYYIAGRKKRFLKIFGNRVNLDEAELMLKEAFPGSELAIGGRDDKMVIFATDGNNDMVSYISAKTGLHSSAFEIKQIDALPYNDSGKVQYKELERYIER